MARETAHGIGFEQSVGLWRRHDTPPALTVAGDGKSPRAGEPLGGLRVVHRPDRLRGRRECGIVAGDDGLRDEHGDPQGRILLEKCLLQQVADHADRLCADHVKRRRRRALVGLALEEQVPDLGPVAEREHELVLTRERREGTCCKGQIATLDLRRDELTASRERIAPEGSDDAHVSPPHDERARPRSRGPANTPPERAAATDW